MKANMGPIDRVIRLILGALIAVLYFTNLIPQGIYGTILLIVGAVFILTSLVSYCPAYLPFGISTKKKR